MLPTYLAISIVATLALASWDRWKNEHKRSWIAILPPLLLGVQLLVLWYDPRSYVLPASVKQDQDRLVSYLQMIKGPIWVVNHGGYELPHQTTGLAHGMALTDVLRGENVELAEQ